MDGRNARQDDGSYPDVPRTWKKKQIICLKHSNLWIQQVT
jgi:hypothetical protein